MKMQAIGMDHTRVAQLILQAETTFEKLILTAMYTHIMTGNATELEDSEVLKSPPDENEEGYELRLRGFRTAAEARAFIGWYEGVWFAARKEERKNLRGLHAGRCKTGIRVGRKYSDCLLEVGVSNRFRKWGEHQPNWSLPILRLLARD